MKLHEKFESLPWHDATMFSLYLDRRRAGDEDTLRMEVLWPDGTTNVVMFSECLHLNATLNFGIVADETIRNANVEHTDQKLEDLRHTWSELGTNVENLTCFRIETASTASCLKIYARNFQLLDHY